MYLGDRIEEEHTRTLDTYRKRWILHRRYVVVKYRRTFVDSCIVGILHQPIYEYDLEEEYQSTGWSDLNVFFLLHLQKPFLRK